MACVTSSTLGGNERTWAQQVPAAAFSHTQIIQVDAWSLCAWHQSMADEYCQEFSNPIILFRAECLGDELGV